jgi:hypothetical protein
LSFFSSLRSAPLAAHYAAMNDGKEVFRSILNALAISSARNDANPLNLILKSVDSSL